MNYCIEADDVVNPDFMPPIPAAVICKGNNGGGTLKTQKSEKL